MTDLDAIELLQTKLEGVRPQDDLKELASILEYMPLAIVQAAAYIREKGARSSVRQYIKAFQRSEKQKTSLLNYEAGQLRRDPVAKNSIIITWQISFDEIQEKWPPSADLLSLMSYFDRQGIPDKVLKVQLREQAWGEDQDIKEDGISEANNDDIFEEAVERLRSYSFESIGEDRQTFEMHALVQLAMRKWLEMHGKEEIWRAQFSRKLNVVFPTGEHKNWNLCKMLFPHAKAAESPRPTNDQSLQDWAQILRKAGWYAWAKGDYVEAERMCELSARVLRKVLGEDDVETLYSRGLLALVYSNQGRWTEAEKIEIQVMETRKRVLGEEHPDTLTSMGNLASTYRHQGRWAEAEKIEIQVMEITKRALGEEHPDTLTSMNNLAFNMKGQDRSIEAIKLMKECVQLCNQRLSPEHHQARASATALAEWQGTG